MVNFRSVQEVMHVRERCVPCFPNEEDRREGEGVLDHSPNDGIHEVWG